MIFSRRYIKHWLESLALRSFESATMAKGKRSNSPKRSRRGGRRSPKKSNKGVHKMISKDVPDLIERFDIEPYSDFSAK